jgi:hypothetical protein
MQVSTLFRRSPNHIGRTIIAGRVGDACARAILEKRRRDLDAGVELLIAKETLTAEEFEPLRTRTTREPAAIARAAS